jgi:hypothetical protein
MRMASSGLKAPTTQQSLCLLIIVAFFYLLYITNKNSLKTEASNNCDTSKELLRKNDDIVLPDGSRDQKIEETSSRKLGDGCYSVYLDVGSNIGVQVRKVFEPEKYPGSAFIHTYNEWLGPIEFRRLPGAVCVFGFEASPVFKERLDNLAKCYNSKNWQTKFFVPRAVSFADDRVLSMWLEKPNPADTNMALSNTVVNDAIIADEASKPQERRGSFTQVKSLDLGKFIMEHIADREIPKELRGKAPKPPAVVVKLDIEGSEYETLLSMLFRGAMCHIDVINIEQHIQMNHLFLEKERPGIQTLYKGFKELLEIGYRCSSKKASSTKIIDVDDESFMKDGQRPPEGCDFQWQY